MAIVVEMRKSSNCI